MKLISIGIRLARYRIYNSLVVNKLVRFCLLCCLDLITLCIPHNVVGLDDLRLSSFIRRFADLFDHILLHHSEVDLLETLDIKREASNFAVDLGGLKLRIVLGAVGIIFCTPCDEFDNFVIVVQFGFKLTKVASQWRILLTGQTGEGDSVGVHIKNTVSKKVKSLVKSNSCPSIRTIFYTPFPRLFLSLEYITCL